MIYTSFSIFIWFHLLKLGSDRWLCRLFRSWTLRWGRVALLADTVSSFLFSHSVASLPALHWPPSNCSLALLLHLCSNERIVNAWNASINAPPKYYLPNARRQSLPDIFRCEICNNQTEWVMSGGRAACTCAILPSVYRWHKTKELCFLRLAIYTGKKDENIRNPATYCAVHVPRSENNKPLELIDSQHRDK